MKTVWVYSGDGVRVWEHLSDVKATLEGEGWKLNWNFSAESTVEFYQPNHRSVTIRVDEVRVERVGE